MLCLNNYIAFIIKKITIIPTINKRKLYYNKIIKNILDNDINNNIYIKFFKYDKNGNPIFKINNIILNYRIGTKSNNAIIYNCYFTDFYGKLYEFTIKLCNGHNINETITLQTLTNAVLNDSCPHFPINYFYLLFIIYRYI